MRPVRLVRGLEHVDATRALSRLPGLPVAAEEDHLAPGVEHRRALGEHEVEVYHEVVNVELADAAERVGG